MDYLFGGRKPAAETIPGDRVRPLHFFENNLLVQGNNMSGLAVFDEVLDPEVLREALEGVVKRPGWERLGGRLKRNASTGKIEWHIPSEFTPSRPALTYSHVAHDMPIAAHPAASRIPKPSTPTWSGRTATAPTASKDYIDTDAPVLGLRVHTFHDATLVALQWQHVAFDALGLKYVLEAWSAMLWGRSGPDDIPTPLGGQEGSDGSDPFGMTLAQGLPPATGEQHVLADRRVGIFGIAMWGLGYGIDTALRAKENGMMCVPASYWQPQLERAMTELRREAVEKGEDPAKVFLTENDIITAFILRCVVSAASMDPDQLVNGSIAMSLRKAFEGADGLIPLSTHHPYVGNAFGWAHVLVRAGDVTSNPLSWLARHVRRAINTQGTRAQHEAYYALVKASGTGLPIVVFGDGGMAQVGFSNLSKAGLFDLDFAPARKGKDEGQDAMPRPCKPVYAQENHGPIKPVDGFFVLGKDSLGNYWTSAYKLKGAWEKIQEQLVKEFGD
ncbi:hypothetical protein KVR01_008953 [Diaporthe batatas]|uniref:uncharacterized protein n=1 Tax=Diaporthe batatas TaxID=748121 RepID=UPI001D055B98|nr:uncharacterized protein KVR01_008953 [Diaporthe batatas]KAG8160689.1 hypothetical protein KVR01_008953 [Diaporthe batatas]